MQVLDVITLQALPYQLRGLILGTLGATLFLVGAYRLVRALVDPFALWDRDQPMVEVIYQKRFLARGPRVVALGGGTGLSTLLRGLKEHTSNLTAVVTVADDGGSSGVLREELGIPAVGRHPELHRRARRRRAAHGPPPPVPVPGCRAGVPRGEDVIPSRDAEARPGLSGHAVGNLLLAALVELEHGDFEEAVREMNRVLAVRGRVVPATATPLTLHARLDDGTEVAGQSRIAKTNRVDRVWVAPDDVRPTDDALRGDRRGRGDRHRPGALFTSILPVLLVPGIREAIAGVGRARRVRVQRRDAARRDQRVRPRGPPRRPRAPRPGRAAGRRPGQQPVRRRAAARAGEASRSGSAGRRRAPTRRAWSSTTSSTPGTPITTTRRDLRPRSWASGSARAAPAPPRRRPCRPDS